MEKSYKKFIAVWMGQLISGIGSGLTAFALEIYVFEKTGSATSVALIALCAFVPTVLLSPLAGVLADRFDRRLLMILGDLLSVGGLLYILVIMLTREPALWQICFGVGISSVFSSLLQPAFSATVNDLLTPEQYAKASGLIQMAGSAKMLLSPMIAGLLLAVTDIKTILVIDISTLFVTVFAVIVVRKSLPPVPKIHEKLHIFADMKEGFAIVAKKRGVIVLLVLAGMVNLYVGTISTLLTPMILPLTDAATLGIMNSVAAVGMLISSIFIGISNKPFSPTKGIWLGLMFAGCFIAFSGVTARLVIICASFFLFFATIPFINTGSEVLLRKSIPNEAQGRAWGIVTIISQLGAIIAFALSGPLADKVFTPLLLEGGSLASTAGKIFGVGEGRGIGLLFTFCGLSVVVFGVIIAKTKSIRALEQE